MRVFYVGPQHTRKIIVLIIIAIIAFGLTANWDRLIRKLQGVRPGVQLEGRTVAGLLPDELTQIVKAMAQTVNREPQNASYFGETGDIIPACPGRHVNVAENVRRVTQAKPGSRLSLIVDEVSPAIDADYYKAVYHGDEGLPRVALAINVAWGEAYLPEMLKALREEKVKVTFFLVGTWVKSFPELVKEMAKEGHEMANHGMIHGHPFQMSREEIKRIIAENSLLIWSVTGQKPANLFAPPYGEVNPEIVNCAAELGYRTIMWSVDSIDWKNPAPDIMMDRILSKIQNGGIILLHPTIPTKTVLPALIKRLRKKGLEPGPVSSVLPHDS